MRPRLSRTAVPLGMPAPTSPVLPPCGTIAMPSLAQVLTTSATADVLSGRMSIAQSPENWPRWSVRKGATVPESVLQPFAPTIRLMQSRAVACRGVIYSVVMATSISFPSNVYAIWLCPQSITFFKMERATYALGALARRSRSLIARPKLLSGMGATAIPVHRGSSKSCKQANRLAAASIKLPLILRFISA